LSDDTRTDPPYVASERDMLAAFLVFHQQTLLWKVSGLTKEQATRKLLPSNTTLLGLLKHTALVHRWWLRAVFAGEAVPFPWSQEDPDADWRVEPDETVEAIIALYNDEIARANTIIAAAQPDDMPKMAGRQQSLRWILVHMVEEMARHNGHADILRELTDGAMGE
jgi:uncharacterized damage-inducible protein DinB